MLCTKDWLKKAEHLRVKKKLLFYWKLFPYAHKSKTWWSQGWKCCNSWTLIKLNRKFRCRESKMRVNFILNLVKFWEATNIRSAEPSPWYHSWFLSEGEPQIKRTISLYWYCGHILKCHNPRTLKNLQFMHFYTSFFLKKAFKAKNKPGSNVYIYIYIFVFIFVHMCYIEKNQSKNEAIKIRVSRAYNVPNMVINIYL